MAPVKKKIPASQRLSIPAGGKASGKIMAPGGAKIAGYFVGELRIKTDLVIAKGGVVEGEVRAELVKVSGRLGPGKVYAGRVEVKRGAELTADVFTAECKVSKGAKVTGKIHWRKASGGSGKKTQATRNRRRVIRRGKR